MAAEFTHLHVHSEYSLLDGYSNTKELAKHAAKLGMSSLAITDHGNMYGAIEFYDACKYNKIKPIIGIEAYVAPESRGKGVGSKCLSSLSLELLNRVGHICLLSNVEFEGAHKSFAKAGFKNTDHCTTLFA